MAPMNVEGKKTSTRFFARARRVADERSFFRSFNKSYPRENLCGHFSSSFCYLSREREKNEDGQKEQSIADS